MLTSKHHSASRRCSAHVAVTYGETPKQYVGQVQHFLRVVPAQ